MDLISKQKEVKHTSKSVQPLTPMPSKLQSQLKPRVLSRQNRNQKNISHRFPMPKTYKKVQQQKLAGKKTNHANS